MATSSLLSLIAEYEGLNIENICTGTCRLSLPYLAGSEVESLIARAISIFSREPTVIDIEPPCVIIGDIHGSILDLVRILQRCGRPSPDNKYLFLGDLIDNGAHSVETLILVLALKVVFEGSVFVIRGDHEFKETNATCNSFQESVHQNYKETDLVDQFFALFQTLPLAAVVDGSVLCVHGGIGPHFTSVEELRRHEKPVSYRGDKVVEEVLWSDPCPSSAEFATNRVRRCGALFNAKAVARFCENNQVSMLVRGHEARKRGVEMEFEGSVITVFSTSNYMGQCGNMSGVLYVRSRTEYEARRYEPLFVRNHIPVSPLNLKYEVNGKRERVKRTDSDQVQLFHRRSLLETLALSPRKRQIRHRKSMDDEIILM